MYRFRLIAQVKDGTFEGILLVGEEAPDALCRERGWTEFTVLIPVVGDLNQATP